MTFTMTFTTNEVTKKKLLLLQQQLLLQKYSFYHSRFYVINRIITIIRFKQGFPGQQLGWLVLINVCFL